MKMVRVLAVNMSRLTICGLVTPYVVKDLSQDWLCNGLSPKRNQIITLTNADLLQIELPEKNLSELWSNCIENTHLKISSTKWWP